MAYIPFQQHFGEGAAVKLRTPQAPDWTAKYQLAAQERRAREAERARQDNAKSDNDALGKEYYKSLGGLDQNWFEKDYDQRDRMLTDIYATVRDAGNDYSNKGFQDKFTKQFNEYRAAQAISKNFRDKIDAKEKEMSDNGVDTYENLDVLENLNNGVYVFEGTDPTTGQPVKTEYNSDKIATGENPYEEFVRMSGVRGNLISKVRPKLNEGKYMGSVIDDAISNSRERTLKSTDAQGNQTWVERTDPTKYDQRILMGFTGRIKEDYEKAFKKDPKGFSSPEEQYLAKYKFSQGEKETGKFAPQGTGVKQGDGYTASQKLIFTPATTPSFAQQQVDVVKQAVSDYDAQYAKYAEAQKAAGKTPEAKKSFSIPEIKAPDNALAFELTDTQSNIDRPFKDDAGNDINGKPLWIKDSNGKTRIDILETTKLHPSLPPTLTIKTVPYSETNKAVLNNAYSDPKAGIYFIDEEKKWRDSLPKKSEQNKSGSAQDNPIPITKGMKFEKGKWYKGANGEVKQYQ